MELYVGLDVSLKETSICVVDGSGEIVCEGAVLSEPEAIAEFVTHHRILAHCDGGSGGLHCISSGPGAQNQEPCQLCPDYRQDALPGPHGGDGDASCRNTNTTNTPGKIT